MIGMTILNMFRKCSPLSANPINEAGLNGDKIENHIVLPTVYHTLAVIVNCAARVQFVYKIFE
jgi:hypothetical protein